jgi:hypothetical protein
MKFLMPFSFGGKINKFVKIKKFQEAYRRVSRNRN